MSKTGAKKIKKIISLITGILLICLLYINPFRFLEYCIQDYIFQRPGIVNTNIVVIGIDENALSELGQFPWSRGVWADIINILNYNDEARPAVIAIDALFDQPGRDAEGNRNLTAAAAASDNIVLASLLDTGFDTEVFSLEMTVTDYIMSFPDLRPHGVHGFVNGFRDYDGVLRNALLRIPYEDEMLYSFPLAAAMMYTGLGPYDLIEWHPYGYIISYISFTGLPGNFFGFSAADLFEDWFDPAQLADAIVLIGPWTIGMADSHPVSISHQYPMYGVEIHANVLQMILEGNIRTQITGQDAFLLTVILLFIAMLIGELISVRISIPFIILMGLAYAGSAWWMFNYGGYVLPVLPPLLALGFVLLYQFIYNYALSAVEKARLKKTFMKYVDPKNIKYLVKNGEAYSDGVSRKIHIAVLFADVRGFTPMTEAFKNNPEAIVETLNSYLELTASCIFKNGGSVDKFVGDAAMGLFNGFVPLDDYIYNSVKAACDMVSGADEINAGVKEKTGVDIGFGVGVHCGEAIVGNLGPSFRKDYTAIGDAVNIAARLESTAQRSQVVISRDVYRLLEGRIDAESIGTIAFKGKIEPLEVYNVLGVK